MYAYFIADGTADYHAFASGTSASEAVRCIYNVAR